jgi:hypothetical protein
VTLHAEYTLRRPWLVRLENGEANPIEAASLASNLSPDLMLIDQVITEKMH